MDAAAGLGTPKRIANDLALLCFGHVHDLVIIGVDKIVPILGLFFR